MTTKNYFVITAWALLLVPRLATAQGNSTVYFNFGGSGSFNQLDAYLRSGAGVTFENPGFFNLSAPQGVWSTFSSPAIVSASGVSDSGPPILSGVAVGFDEAASGTFSVDFYEWNGDTLSDSFNIFFINGFDYDGGPASVTEPAPFAVPEPSILALAGVCAVALAVRKATK